MGANKDSIFTAAKALGGPDSDGLQQLCGAAEDALAARLKDGVDISACGDAFIQAAAMKALAMLSAAEAAGAVSYTAGVVSVTAKSGAAGAAALDEQAERLMAPYVVDGGFAFTGVQG